ncbi:MAG TPA: ABC transporter ATP-binding protein [Amaricoccus sp.]|uniref:ABC transporter ATP-binding protein n=1 Tax=Amaricoccus sp. TaxID=1872485 RepID=UPI001DF30550|nr:ABC transporter ATP-binding protein [Amaricoccus sp.]MCB1372605.1 ABC transporter ATP-binding protein [Paracoccaceae bacterium]MCB1401315.1 ABC transporter ATP-binding protein [Paracoccaceae bacterium]HPG22502.1 ABC transporter ATP-binding protein [Amaricoccus sp.]HRW17097.1 ABC transporter ATP-binding protein [Amaricoccus sp.]
MTALLTVADVSKRFGRVEALTGLTLSVAPGERVALLGHNGAGKTTLLRLILGFLRPDAGSILVGDHAPDSTAARRIVAYLPENVAFPKALTGRELIGFYARLRNVGIDDAMAALERVGLGHAADRASGNYSKGMRQRLGLAQALLGAPRLMLLDEPTSGLDPLSRRDFYALVDKVAAAGTAVLLSSHSLSEIEARTDRVAILREGRLVADAPLSRLQAEAALPVRIRVRAQPDTIDEVSDRLGGTRVNGQTVELVFSQTEKMRRLAAISALGSLVTDFDLTQPSLDDIYVHFSRPAGEGNAS